MKLTRAALIVFAVCGVLPPADPAAAQSRPSNEEKMVKNYLLAQARRGEIEAVVREYLARHPEQVGRLLREHLAKNPEVLESALDELIKRRSPRAANAPSQLDSKAVIKANAALLFASPRQVNLGDRDGDVTLVEFFDYNCGYCKRALADMLTVMRDDSKVKIVLKELPILGQGSVEAAQVAIAVRMQDPDGQKYLAFHQKLLGSRGPANKASSIAAAQEVGLDVARLEKDLMSDEVRKTLDESSQLARLLGISGTPGYVIGEAVVAGAIGTSGLREKIRLARQ